jgi:hypothetical protein
VSETLASPPHAPRSTSPPMSRTSCVVVLLVWLCLMTVPFFALALAVKGELTWRRGEFVEDRVWLVNAETGIGQGRVSGIGYSAARVVSDQTPVDGALCVRTNVYFLLWNGPSERVMFCECYLHESGRYALQGSCPQ